MGFNSAFKGLKLLKKPSNGRLNNLNYPVLNVLTSTINSDEVDGLLLLHLFFYLYTAKTPEP